MQTSDFNKKQELTLKGEEFHLSDKILQIHELGINPWNVKLLVNSYRMSKCRIDGVAINCDKFIMRIGPQTKKTWPVKKLKKAAIEFLELNPFAAIALANDYWNSKVAKQGINMLIDDVNVMIGPQNGKTFKVR